MKQNLLSTITRASELFLKDESVLCTFLTFNVQSLTAHSPDIETDKVLSSVNVMSLVETWQRPDDVEVPIKGFRLVAKHKRNEVRAAGVAIYERSDSITTSLPHEIIKPTESDYVKIGKQMRATDHIGDICAVETTVHDHKLLVVSTYISPNASLQDAQEFIFTNLVMYTPKMAEMYDLFNELTDRDLSHYSTLPIIFAGDFNIDISKPENKKFLTFMKKMFNLDLQTDPDLPTTRNQSTIDLVFTRHIDTLPCFNYVSYFSHHRPILSKIFKVF